MLASLTREFTARRNHIRGLVKEYRWLKRRISALPYPSEERTELAARASQLRSRLLHHGLPVF